MEDLTIKTVMLTGFCDTQIEDEWSGEMIDGHIIQLDGKNYAIYVDPEDGYRSYGSMHETCKPCTNTFPPQKVEMIKCENPGGNDWYEDPKYSAINLHNPETAKLILEISTTWYDSYYPIGRCEWHPENLPINKDR